MTNKEMLTKIMEKLDSMDSRITALEKGKSIPSSKKTSNVVVSKKASLKTTSYSTAIADYEPTKKNGFYKWGKKTDTVKSGNYMAMRKAYCYAVASNGACITSDEAFKLKIKIDFSANSPYYKAKAEFEKKFPYIKASDR